MKKLLLALCVPLVTSCSMYQAYLERETIKQAHFMLANA